MTKTISQVGVIGAGTMGLGITQVAAMAGYKVQLFDAQLYAAKKAIAIITDNLDKGIARAKLSEEDKTKTLGNITLVKELTEFNSDLLIEAIIEDLVIKQKLFSQLESIVSAETILCTNTSSISVTKIAHALTHKQRFLGMHFFNPAHIMKLVEIVSTEGTGQQCLGMAVDFVKSLGKIPVMAKDAPGFIVNRVARQFYVESLRVLEEQVATIEDIDKLVEASGFKMGPFRLMDLIGVDTNFAVTSTMYQGFHQDPKFRPSRIQEQKVAAGHLGRKSGQGFYQYE